MEVLHGQRNGSTMKWKYDEMEVVHPRTMKWKHYIHMPPHLNSHMHTTHGTCTLRHTYTQRHAHADTHANTQTHTRAQQTNKTNKHTHSHSYTQGNPCVEEPDYRLIVIYNIPSLQILDLHTVTDAEREKAKFMIGEEVEVRSVCIMYKRMCEARCIRACVGRDVKDNVWGTMLKKMWEARCIRARHDV